MQILYVENHRDTALATSRVLTRKGFSVVVASTLAEARRVCGERRFDVLICEILLPDGEGWELASVAKQCGATVIAVTGCDTLDDVARSNRCGFAAHLLKPIRINEIEAAIAAIAPDKMPSTAG